MTSEVAKGQAFDPAWPKAHSGASRHVPVAAPLDPVYPGIRCATVLAGQCSPESRSAGRQDHQRSRHPSGQDIQVVKTIQDSQGTVEAGTTGLVSRKEKEWRQTQIKRGSS